MVRLRHPSAVRLSFTQRGLGAHHSPYAHAFFALLFGLCLVALVLTTFCDPGIIVAPTKDELKPVGRIFAFERRIRLDKFL